MKAVKIIKSVVFGIIAGAFAILLVSAQPSSYGIAITPLLLAAGMVPIMIGELVETIPDRKTFYGMLFHVTAAIVLLVYLLATGMLSGYEYVVWDYYTGASVGIVKVSGAAWWLPFGLVIVRVLIEAFIGIGKGISKAFDDITFDIDF